MGLFCIEEQKFPSLYIHPLITPLSMLFVNCISLDLFIQLSSSSLLLFRKSPTLQGFRIMIVLKKKMSCLLKLPTIPIFVRTPVNYEPAGLAP